MKRTENVTPLGIWMWNRRVSNPEFAKLVAEELGIPAFSASTVEKWRYGHRFPAAKHLDAIKKLTGITADQMLEGRKKHG